MAIYTGDQTGPGNHMLAVPRIQAIAPPALGVRAAACGRILPRAVDSDGIRGRPAAYFEYTPSISGASV
jgi:hypothetical protein